MHVQRNFIGVGLCVGMSVGRSVGRSVCLSARFLSNHDCGGYQTCIYWYVQRALNTAEFAAALSKNSVFTGGGYKKCIMCTFPVKAENGGYQMWICG